MLRLYFSLYEYFITQEIYDARAQEAHLHRSKIKPNISFNRFSVDNISCTLISNVAFGYTLCE